MTAATVNIAAMTAPSRPTPSSSSAGERLAKRVAALLPCSRREAEQYIEGGWVRVDGQVVEEPQFRVLAQRVEIDPNASLLPLTPVSLLLHKPAGVTDGTESEPERPAKPGRPGPRDARALLTSANQLSPDPSGLQWLKRHGVGLESLVPLEAGASGLLVFTQDWRLARKLTEDAGLIEHEIIVEVRGEVPAPTLHRLNQGLNAQGRPLPPVKVSLNSTGEQSSKLRFAVKGSHPGLMAYLCERTGLEILAMKRIRVGRVLLAALPPGQWRYLLPHERV